MLIENSDIEETFLIYLFEWEHGLTELNSNFLTKWDTLVAANLGIIPLLPNKNDKIGEIGGGPPVPILS